MNTIRFDAGFYPQLLNQLSDCTGDYYVYYKLSDGIVYFSDNIREMVNDIFPPDVTCCPLSAWQSLIEPSDARKVLRISRKVLDGTMKTYDLTYRIIDRYGQSVWVNSRGKYCLDSDSQTEYVLGSISRRDEYDRDGAVYHQRLLKKELRNAFAAGMEGYLLVVGVDNLKTLNLRRGREYGDSVLKRVSASMLDSERDVRRIYRINGDCFCAIVLNADQKEVEAYFERVRNAVRQLCSVSGGCVSLCDYHVPNGAMLIQYAESSLEMAKQRGKDQLCFFSHDDYEQKLAAMELQEELEAAVKNGFEGFWLEYQAQICSKSLDLFGAEALLRFRSPRRGNVSPVEFIPILEESELIYPVGMWVIRQALRQCKIWRRQLPHFHMSVNMSYAQLRRPQIESDVIKAVAESGLGESALTIEVTEGMELQDYGYLNAVFSAWKKEGIEISVDDFGTGYSSLSWLKELAIDEIKIDRSFVNGIRHSAYNLRLLSNMIELAESCQIRVCCEGIETAEDLHVLEKLHPSLYQGYLFAKPTVPEAFSLQHLTWKDRVDVTDAEGEPVAQAHFMPDLRTLEHAVMETTEDVISICDVDTYELYYLNAAGQRLFGVRDYQGRKCYNVFRGKDTPCAFCPNASIQQNSTYIWENWNEYCGRHFLFKDKLLSMGGKKLRLEINTDITKKEFISQVAQERLEFSRKIVGYLETLNKQKNFAQAVQQVLASVGEFYRADRAYLFERRKQHEGCWANTYEWCADGVTPQKDSLQEVSQEALHRWMELFARNESVIMHNLKPLQKSSPQEWLDLSRQNIQRLIAVPMISDGGGIEGFIGVDNPRYAIRDDAQVRVLACFLLNRYQRDREDRKRKGSKPET